MSEFNKLGQSVKELQALGVMVYILSSEQTPDLLTKELKEKDKKFFKKNVIFLVPSAKAKEEKRPLGKSGLFKIDEVDFKNSFQQLDESIPATFGDFIEFHYNMGNGVITSVGILPILQNLWLCLEGFSELPLN